MRKIPPTILLVAIAFFLSGCYGVDGSGLGLGSSGGSGDDVLLADTAISYFATPSESAGDLDSGSGSSSGAGNHNPEPGSLALLGSGLAALLGAKLRKRSK